SSQEKWAVTSARYQPFSFGSRSRAPVIVGLVLSMLTCAVSVASLPALSFAVPATGCCVPSLVTVCGAVHDAMPERPGWSSHVNVTVTSALFQPLSFGSGDCAWVIVGAVLSIDTETVWCSSALPAASTLQYSSVWTPSAVMSALAPVCSEPPSRIQ